MTNRVPPARLRNNAGPRRTGRFSVDGVSLAYDDVGSGEPLVLVHGHPFDRSMWTPQVSHFSRSGWRVVAADLRGYGESSVGGDKTTLETFARDTVALLDHLGLEHGVIGGLSMGGQIVMEIYRLFPHRVRGVVLADTSAAAETDEGKRLRYETAERLLREGMRPYAEEVLPKMVAPGTIEAHPAVPGHVMTMMLGTAPEGAAAALRGRAERPDYVETLARVAVPALVVVGREDTFTPVADAALMHERMPDSALVVVDDAAHMPNLERPDAFNLALERFLNRIGD